MLMIQNNISHRYQILNEHDMILDGWHFSTSYENCFKLGKIIN